MRLSFFSKIKKTSAGNNGDARDSAAAGGLTKHAAKLEEAARLMAERACGQAIAALKDIDKKNADSEVWLMRAALYAERDDMEKAQSSFQNLVEALTHEPQKRDCWVWLPGIAPEHARLWSASVPDRLASVRIGADADGVMAGEVLVAHDADITLPARREGATRTHVALTLFAWAVRHGAVLARSLAADVLAGTPFAEAEAEATGRPGNRALIVPADDEVACLSKIYDPCVRYAWLTRERSIVQRERHLQRNLGQWAIHAGLIVSHFQLDAQGRWDVLMPRFIFVDPQSWPARKSGDGALRVLHFDDHPDYSGTIFLEHAVERLRAKGTAIELVKMKRGDEASRRAAYAQADVLADGLNAPGYSADAVEAMASGLVVTANLESEFNCRVYRRYSFLGECPARSATPESIESVLTALSRDAGALDEIGARGREYVARHHSLDTAAKLFTSIDECLQVDPRVEKHPRPSLANYFHPKQWALHHKPAARA